MLEVAQKYLQLKSGEYYKCFGKVDKVVGLTIESIGPKAKLNDLCMIFLDKERRDYVMSEVVGFKDSHIILMPFDNVEGVGVGCIVENTGHPLTVAVGDELLGHTVDGIGRVTDCDEKDLELDSEYPIEAPPPDPMSREIIMEGADEAIKSLELGAFDFVTKPNNIIEAKGNQFKETLLRVVYAAVRITPAHSASRNLTVVEKKAGAIVNKHKAAGSNKIVAIASSTGGPKALQSVIPFLPAELLAPVVLVQHMPAGFTKSMAERLNELSQVQVKEASNGEVLKNGVVYIAPGGTHIAIKKSGASHVISFNDMPPISGLKPCANIMFDSLTSSNYDEVVCVVLTGMGADGTNGILSLGKSKPIYVIAQDEKSSVVYGMPRAIYEAGVVDEVVTLSDVAKAITKNVGVK